MNNIQYTSFSFTCAHCGERMTGQFLYVEKKNQTGKLPTLTSVFACKHCEKRNKIEYTCGIRKNGTYRLVVLSCKIGDQVYPHKRFRS